MKTSNILWAVAAASALLILIAGWADKKQSARRNLDRPGWVPWPLVQVFALIGTVVAAVLAMKG